jgi:hypothetical protein
MKKASALYPPVNPPAFAPPEGIQIVRVDPETQLPATSECPVTYEEVFLEGTVPVERCPLHRPSFSDSIEHGAAAAGRSLFSGFASAGKAIGGLFGIGGGNKPEEKKK